MKRFIVVFFCVFSFLKGFSQQGFTVSGDVFGRRVFIKNNGQFDNVLEDGQKIKYGYVNEQEEVYFNQTGVVYSTNKEKHISEFEMERIERGKVKPKSKVKAIVHLNWLNANPNIEILESEEQSYYHTFGDAQFNSKCFKKITYKNVYDHIDIEYLLSNERLDGIKYNVILHPGADIKNVRFNYSGDVTKITIKEGQLIVKTSIGKMAEFAPVSFQNGKSIDSKFILDSEGNVSFDVSESYDKSKELIIDPWVVNLNLTSNNCGFDVDFDNAGNYYVYGGSGPFLVTKYAPTGSLIWTFNGYISSVSWPANYMTSYYASNFVVDKITEKIYIGEGPSMAGAKVVRLDQNGVYDNFIAGTTSLWEMWDLGFNCSDGTLFCLGGSSGGAIVNDKSAIKINTSTAALTVHNFTGLTTSQQDIVTYATDPSGTVFYLFASNGTASINNRLMKANATFNGNNWIAPTTFNAFIEGQTKHYPNIGMISYGSNGFNALTVNSNFLYYYDGLNLAAYNKNTGVIIGSIILSGQTGMVQGGIAVDECDNLYVGGNGFIRCYHFDGTTFTPNGTISVLSNTVNKYVTDIRLDANTKLLYVCGSGFGGV